MEKVNNMGIFTAILKRPSERTLMEASLTGTAMIMITSICTSGYIIFFTEMNFWYKIFAGLGEFAILLFMFSSLATQYVQYYTFKQALGLYPPSTKLFMKLEEARQIKLELEKLIKENHNEMV